MKNGLLGYGYLRKDGKKGIRNQVLLIYTVECSKYACEKIAASFQSTESDFAVHYVGNDDCEGNQVILRELLKYATHPNVGAVLAVGMGCEYIEAKKIADYASAAGRITDILMLQNDGGTEKVIEKGRKVVKKMLAALEQEIKVPIGYKDLCIGVECGGSDFSSGLAANPLVGKFSDRIIENGGTTIAEEIFEAIGLKEYLVSRCVDDSAKKQVAATYEKTVRFCNAMGRYSVSPGNHDGGLTTIEEKSLGAVCKTGESPIQGVLKLAQTPPHPGLWLLDTMPDYYIQTSAFHGGDSCSMMTLAASGCQLLILTSGLGHIAGNVVCPVLKITGNNDTYERMADDMDFNASGMISQEVSIEEALGNLEELVREIISGKKTASEKIGCCSPTLPPNNQHPYLVLETPMY